MNEAPPLSSARRIPLIDRQLRLEVNERVNHDVEIITPAQS
ncbi:hypothetical protein [Sodalis-like endosymbiont of Proechinophthirus fluctus]|nr:hypothetical protein [Sodalis-like endosymbiont of Proechinophthirus fluctus]